MPDRLQMYNLITRLGIEQTLTKDFWLRWIFPPLHHQRNVWPSQTTNNTNRELAFDWRYTLAESDLPKVWAQPVWQGLKWGFPCSTMISSPSRCACPSTTN